MLSSFNSFSRKFTSVFEPVTPVCSLNALAIDSASASSGVIPPGWTLVTGTIPFVNDGIRKYFRFPISAVRTEFRFNVSSLPMAYGTNGGYTTIIVLRINTTNAPLATNLPAILSGLGISGLSGILAITNGGVCTLGTANGLACPHRTTTVEKNRFVFIAHTFANGATTPTVITYLDGKRFGITTSGYTNIQNSTTDSVAFHSLRNSYTLGYGLDHDLMYFAQYDRPLSDNDIKKVFNSVAPVMETAAPLYTTSTSFTTISVPSSPLFEFNAYNYTQTNGQSYVAGASGWVSNGVQNFNWGVDAIGRRYINFNTNHATLTKNYTVSSSMHTNQGYTFVLLFRLNEFTNGGQNSLFSTALANFYLNYEYFSSSGQLLSPNFLYLTASSTIGGQGDADMPSLSPTSFQTDKFMLLTYVVSGSVASIYINNLRMVFKTVTPVGSSANQASFETSATIGFHHQNILGPLQDNVDVSYMSFYDRPLNTTEMTTLYNSVAMLLD